MNAVSRILCDEASEGPPVWPPVCCTVVITKIKLGHPWVCLAPVLRLTRIATPQPFCETCSVLHCPPGEEDLPVSAIGQEMLDPFAFIPQGPDIYCETEWGGVKEVQFCLIPPNISYLTGKDYEKWDSFNIWWHLSWTFREGTQKNSLQITLFCLHFWEWKCEL